MVAVFTKRVLTFYLMYSVYHFKIVFLSKYNKQYKTSYVYVCTSCSIYIADSKEIHNTYPVQSNNPPDGPSIR